MKLAKALPIRGRLIDLQGKPIPNATLTVVSVSAAENDDLTAAYNAYRVNPEWTPLLMHLDGKATVAPMSAKTDADGKFEVTSCFKPGTWR